ncbi:MAG TPA: c-type cytochrome [Balneolaceae bacterium]|nr:c-type cytochrome [Balneolaceae bacterium]
MRKQVVIGFLWIALISWGCSSSSKKTSEEEQSQQRSENGLTPFQLENGIGPITEAVEVGPIDTQMAARGKEIFLNNCSSCHKIGERYVGPDLQEVTSRRTPAYIMNMILNPTGMTQKHPTAHKLLENFAAQMADLSLQKDQARAIVEYLRSVNPDLEENDLPKNN